MRNRLAGGADKGSHDLGKFLSYLVLFLCIVIFRMAVSFAEFLLTPISVCFKTVKGKQAKMQARQPASTGIEVFSHI